MRPRPRSWRVFTGRKPGVGLFEEILLLHMDGLYGLAIRLTKDPDAAADLLQDAALRAFRSFHQLREPGAARAWFARIITTTFLNRYSGHRDLETLALETEPLDEETPEAALLRRCDADEVEAALAELPEEFRVTILLADIEDFPLSEIASLSGCPLGTVASRLARGRNFLRKRLAHRRGGREVDA